MIHRKLALKRDVLLDLSDEELGGVRGAGTTSLSCLDYISACVLECLIEPSDRRQTH